MSQRDVKTVNSVADAYRSMYAQPIEINEDILNEELIDSLIEEVREEELNEVSLTTNMLQKILQMFGHPKIQNYIEY